MLHKMDIYNHKRVIAFVLFLQILYPHFISAQWYIDSQNKEHSKICTGEVTNGYYPALIDQQGRRFIIHWPGLAGSSLNSISFESVDRPGFYLRHYGNTVYLEDKATGRNPNIFNEDATYIIRPNTHFKGYYQFESINMAGKFLRHSGDQIIMSAQSDGVGDFNADTSWRFFHRNVMLQTKFQETCKANHCKVNRISTNSSIISEAGMLFNVISPGPSGEQHSVGFESVSLPGQYIREYSNYAFIEGKDSRRSQSTWDRDATFFLRYGTLLSGYYAIESSQHSNWYLHVIGSNELRFDKGDGSSLFLDEASFRVVEGPVYMESQNMPGYKMDLTENNEVVISVKGHKFNMVYPGLTGEPGSTSFESYSFPNYYLRHQSFQLHLHDANNPPNAGVFLEDATFRLKMDIWYMYYLTFQSVNYDDRNIRHMAMSVSIDPYEDSDSYRGDASYQSVEAEIDWTDPGNPPGSDDNKVGLIVGATIAGIFVIALIVVIVIFTNKKFAWMDSIKRMASGSNEEGTSNPSYETSDPATASTTKETPTSGGDDGTSRPSAARRLSRSLSNTMSKLKPTGKKDDGTERQSRIDMPSDMPELSAGDFQPTSVPTTRHNPFNTESAQDRRSATNPMFDLHRMSTMSTADDSLEIVGDRAQNGEPKPKVPITRQDSLLDSSPVLTASGSDDGPFSIFGAPSTSSVQPPTSFGGDMDDIFGTSQPIYSTVDKSKKRISSGEIAIPEEDLWDSFTSA